MNAQFAIKDDTVYVLEVNPRASRTVPYLSKATGVPLAKVAARVMIGRTLAEPGLTEDLGVAGVFVLPTITRAATLASGTPVAFDRYGTVRDARGLTSST